MSCDRVSDSAAVPDPAAVPGEAEARALVIERQSRLSSSSGRLVAWLMGRGMSEEAARDCVAGLERDGYVDDYAYAASVARARQGRRSESRQALRQRLERLAVKPEAIAACLSACPGDLSRAADWLRSNHRPTLLALRDATPDRDEEDESWRRDRATLIGILRQAEGRGFMSSDILAILRRWQIEPERWLG
ncbi:MAG: RecX family transcriptional regulator [Bacillota bacterium]|nr:RecX family transcriptional regulator [Bacillota bacterium]